MQTSLMRASRLVSIVLLLQAKGRMTAHDLAETLEVSVRTIYRDVDALNAAGIPVIGEAGTDGGYRLLDGYRTRLTGLTADEATALFLAGVPAAAEAIGLSDLVTTTQRKLLAAIPSPARERAELARQRVHIDLGPWAFDGGANPLLPQLHRAIWEQFMVRLRYGTGKYLHRVAPLGLVCKGTNWYLIGSRDGSSRTYRVSRIHDAEVTDVRFERPPDFDLVGYWQESSRSYAGSFARTVVKLRLRGNALIRVGWVQAHAKTIGEPDANGWADAELTLEEEDHALTTIRTLGDDVIVCEPAELREKALGIARSFVELNS